MTNHPLDASAAGTTARALMAVVLGVVLSLTVILQLLPATSSRAAETGALPTGLAAHDLADLALPVFVVGALLALLLVAGVLIALARATQRH